jgi:hypothetical protein
MKPKVFEIDHALTGRGKFTVPITDESSIAGRRIGSGWNTVLGRVMCRLACTVSNASSNLFAYLF